MDSSDTGGEGGGLGDWSAGTIVWVRRRNGSWWPGRILGQEELAASHLMSPRSGTPVKLLGREDASVDWYNLEKSKRVKAFRCRDFDGCIQRAEASQGISIKKREKYARREDAILHALELERKQLALEYQKQGISMDVATSKSSDCFKSDVNNYSSGFYFRNEKNDVPHGKFAGQKAQLGNSAWSNQDQNIGNVDHRYKSKSKKKREEETSEAIRRTRELHQYFVHVASKRKLSQSTALGPSLGPLNNGTNDLPQPEHIQGGINLSGGGKPVGDEKRKRADGGTFGESLVKKRDRCQPLVQVLQSSAESPLSHSFHREGSSGVTSVQGVKVKDQMPAVFRGKRSQCIYLPADSSDSPNRNNSSSMQKLSTGADFETGGYLQQPVPISEGCTSSDLIKKNATDSLEGECSETETEEEAGLLHSTTRILEPHPNACDPYVNQASDELGNWENDEIPAPTYVPELNALEGVEDGSELGVSKWHMKGKRNIRNVAKRPIDVTDGNPLLDKSHGFMKGSLHRSYETNPKRQKTGASSQRSLGQGKEELNYDLDGNDLAAKDVSHTEVMRYHGKKHPSILKACRDTGQSYAKCNDSEFDCFKTITPKQESDRATLISRKAYWEESSSYQLNYAFRLGGEVGPMLFHVDLKAQGSYLGEHVPLVSLMSRWNGKAVVGHPVQIEILEDGCTSKLISGCWTGLEDFRAAQPVWRTGRRTAMLRVPRPNTARTALEGDGDGSFLYSVSEPSVKKGSALFNHQARLAKRSISNARKTSSKSHKKSSKKVSLSSQKVRTLSSISTSRKLYGSGSVAKPSRGADFFGGLIKPDGTVPLVTCVPVKVVFSRILEAVGRPPIATVHRIRMASLAVRDPPP